MSKPREGGDDLFNHAVGKVFLLWIAAQILERQYRNRWNVRGPQRRLRGRDRLSVPCSGRHRGPDKAIAAPRQGLNPAFAAWRCSQSAAQRRNLDRKIAVLDRQARPRGLDQRILGDGLSRLL